MGTPKSTRGELDTYCESELQQLSPNVAIKNISKKNLKSFESNTYIL